MKQRQLVDAELAKEKLARICEEITHYRNADGMAWMRDSHYTYQDNAAIAKAIRNTDLTDCQPQPTVERLSAVAYRLRIVPHGEIVPLQILDVVRDYYRAIMDIAPAPDQGSVRNATDVLRELVACKDLEDKIRTLDDPMNWKDPPELAQLQSEYAGRQQYAWEAARAITGTFACPICGKATPHYHDPKLSRSEQVAEHLWDTFVELARSEWRYHADQYPLLASTEKHKELFMRAAAIRALPDQKD